MDLDELQLMEKFAAESVVLRGLGPEDATSISKRHCHPFNTKSAHSIGGSCWPARCSPRYPTSGSWSPIYSSSAIPGGSNQQQAVHVGSGAAQGSPSDQQQHPSSPQQQQGLPNNPRISRPKSCPSIRQPAGGYRGEAVPCSNGDQSRVTFSKPAKSSRRSALVNQVIRRMVHQTRSSSYPSVDPPQGPTGSPQQDSYQQGPPNAPTSQLSITVHLASIRTFSQVTKV
ncbi:hypothetical protein quinque_008202 [Culex quinquefasciatus]